MIPLVAALFERREPERDPALSQWFTPPELARRIVQWAHVAPGSRVLEPAAGDGAIVHELLRVGACVDAVELDPRMVRKLARAHGGDLRVTISHGDYLDRRSPPVRWPLAVANPPYDRGLDTRFVARMLGDSARVVVLARINVLSGAGRYRDIWQCAELTRLAVLTRRPHFGGPHAAGTHDMIVAELVPRVRVERAAGERDRPIVEWWD